MICCNAAPIRMHVNIVLNRKGASDTTGQLSFELPENASIFGRIAPSTYRDVSERYKNSTSFKVPTVRLDYYCLQNSISKNDFLKLDVEGYELSVLRGMGDLFKEQRVREIYIELCKENHDRMGSNFAELITFIVESNYKVFTFSEDCSQLEVDPFSIIDGNYLLLPH